MNNIYFNEYPYLNALLLMCIIWCFFSYMVYDKIKKAWLYIMFPIILLSIPIMIYAISSTEQTILIVLLVLVYSYYVFKTILSKINKADTILIPVALFIINMYIVLKSQEGVCLIAP